MRSLLQKATFPTELFAEPDNTETVVAFWVSVIQERKNLLPNYLLKIQNLFTL